MSRFVLPVANLPSSFQDIANEVENVFDHLFNGKSSLNMDSIRYSPRLNIHEFEDKFEVTMDLPGMNPAEVQIEMKDNQLSIQGERKLQEHGETVKAWRSERAYGKFRRVLQLPESANGDAIDAVYDAGVLTISVPKAPKPVARQITIRSATAPSSQSASE